MISLELERVQDDYRARVQLAKEYLL